MQLLQSFRELRNLMKVSMTLNPLKFNFLILLRNVYENYSEAWASPSDPNKKSWQRHCQQYQLYVNFSSFQSI